MNINKIKKAFSFIGMEGVATKITTLCLISGISILLFTQDIMFSSSDKSFSGELTNGLAVLMNVKHPTDSFYPVYIKLDDSRNLIRSNKGNNSKCEIRGMAYTGSSSPATIDIAFKGITCEDNGIFKTHKIDGRIINIRAETVPSKVLYENKIQSIKNDMETHKIHKKSIPFFKRFIKKIEDAGFALILPAHTQIQGRILQKEGKVIIETVN